MEYLVEGAKLICVNGSIVTQLKVLESHSYTSGGKEKANCKDCKAYENIPPFGRCQKNEEDHMCEGFMDLDEKWENTDVNTTKPENVSGEDAISLNSVLLCKKGGVIMPVSSGQGYDGKIDWDNLKKRYQDVVSWAAGQKLLTHVYRKDPININTGNYIYEKEDLFIDGELPLSFKLFYNALDCGEQGSLGEGWHHNYEIYFKKIIGENLVGIILEDGHELPYCRKLEQKYTPIMGDAGILRKSEYGYVYEQEGLVYEFNQDGRLVKQRDTNGNSRILSYNIEGLLIRIENNSGGFLYYTYNKENQLISVIDHAGRKVLIEYQYGKLRWFTNTIGGIYEYEYNENGIVSGVITPREIHGVKNEYDGANRVLKQTLPDDSVVELRYDDKNNRTYMKEQNGNIIAYESDARMRNIRTIYEDGEEIFAYNDRNLPIQYTDKNGNTTKNSYDNRGNLTQVINALGEKVCMTYDCENHLISLKLPDNSQIKFHYDSQGNLIETINQVGVSYKALYDNYGRVLSVIQPDYSHIQFNYDSRGNVIQKTDAFGHGVSYEYDELNQITQMTDGNDNITRYSYNPNGNLIEIINSVGNTKKFAYNKSGKVIGVTDFDGSTQSVEYDDCNRPCQYIDSENNTTCYQYDKMGNLVNIKYPNGGVAIYEYDHFDRLKTYTDVMGAIVKYNYDAVGNLIKIIGPCGESTTISYDSLNRRTCICEPDGNSIYYEYNSQGNVSKITDKAGNMTSYEYDLCGRKVKEIDMLGNISAFVYDSLGNLVEETDGAGRKVSHSYYPGGLIQKSAYSDGISEHYRYDGNRNLIETKNQAGYIIHYAYDELDRIIQNSNSKNQNTRFAYDAADRLISKVDANGAETRYTYSSNGNLSSVVDACGNKTKCQYDSMGNLSAVFMPGDENEENLKFEEAIKLNEKNHNLHLTMFDRDLLGRVRATIDALGTIERYEYDKSGNIIKKSDNNGYETQYTYNLLNQISCIIYSDERQVEFFYDSFRHLKEVRDWLGVTNITSDKYGRVQDITDYRGKKVSYEFGRMGERKAVIYPDGSKVNYSYDSCLRTSEVTFENEKIRYHYDKNGCLSQKGYMNGLATNYAYDEAGDLTGFSHETTQGVLDQYEYSYDQMGNKKCVRKYRKGLDEDTGKFFFEYDMENRLIGIRDKSRILNEYKYDTFGNRCYSKITDNLPTTYSYNALNQLTTESGSNNKQYLYDKRGNLNQTIENGKEVKTYSFNTLNRLAGVIDSAGNRSLYEYNGLGGRVSSQFYSGNEATSRICEQTLDLIFEDHNLLMQEERGKNQKFIWDKGLVGFDNGNGNQNVLLDDLGSPIRLLYSNARISQSYAYDEFGNSLHESDRRIQPFGYTGYMNEDNSDTLYAYAREYKPEWGKFISEDLLKGNLFIPCTQNCYNYCFNNPLNYVDLDGAWPKSVSNAANWVKDKASDAVNWGKEHKTAVVVATVAVTAVVAAPVVIAAFCGGATATVTIGAVGAAAALGAAVGGGADLAVQAYEIHTGNRDKINKKELLINAVTGAGAAVTGPIGASVMAVTNYVGTQLVNDKDPTLAGVGVNAISGYFGGWLAGKLITKATEIALTHTATSSINQLSIIGGKLFQHSSIAGYLTNLAFAQTYKNYLVSGVLKAFLATNPWLSSFITGSIEQIWENTQFAKIANEVLCAAAQ